MTPAYVAGLIDGEGCIYAQIHKRVKVFSLVVSIGMAEKAKSVLEAIQATYGGKVRLFRQKTKKWSAAYTWRVNGKVAANFLREIYPHLQIKQEQARLALRLQEIIDNLPIQGEIRRRWTTIARRRAETIWLRLKELNHKGPEKERNLTPPIPGVTLFALLVAGRWVKPQRSLFTDLGWEPLSEPWPQSVIVVDGAAWTANFSECPNEGDGFSVCSLDSILETEERWLARNPGKTTADWNKYIEKYLLSPKAAQGILRRAAKRNRALLPHLEADLVALASTAPDGAGKTTKT